MRVVNGIMHYLQASFVFDPDPKIMRSYERIGNNILSRNGANLSAVLYSLYEGDFEDLTTKIAAQPLHLVNLALQRCFACNAHSNFRHLHRVSAFFNFIKDSTDINLPNPCYSPMLKKSFKNKRTVQWKMLDKDIVDEIIFRTENPRNRLMLELMARGGMRIGEVLELTPTDIEDRKIALKHPKSGKEMEWVFIPKKVATRLKDYIKEKSIDFNRRIFPISYPAARIVVIKAGNLVGIHLRPHDLRRHAATFASRAGVPIEIVSKIILRHSSLSITQLYLGKVSDAEAIRWIDHLHG